jgi:2-methylisocitrate lyase-like PEP mutase family enzyme
VAELDRRCDLLRSLHVPGAPLLLPNAWDVATARAVVAAGYPVIATSSGGVAAALGYQDHEGSPPGEMLAADARIVRGVEVPVTVDAEAGYGLEPDELVSALREMGAAGCNLEDSVHAAGTLREVAKQAAWLRAVREAADGQGYRLVVNARVDVFLSRLGTVPQDQLVEEALERARAYLEAGADCVYPIALWHEGALATFVRQTPGPVNALASSRAPSVPRLAELGVARVSYGTALYREAMERFQSILASLPRP